MFVWQGAWPVGGFTGLELLLAAAYHTAMHRKYGDPQEPSRRFGHAMGLAELH
jgi:hypothetical protein